MKIILTAILIFLTIQPNCFATAETGEGKWKYTRVTTEENYQKVIISNSKYKFIEIDKDGDALLETLEVVVKDRGSVLFSNRMGQDFTFMKITKQDGASYNYLLDGDALNYNQIKRTTFLESIIGIISVAAGGESNFPGPDENKLTVDSRSNYNNKIPIPTSYIQDIFPGGIPGVAPVIMIDFNNKDDDAEKIYPHDGLQGSLPSKDTGPPAPSNININGSLDYLLVGADGDHKYDGIVDIHEDSTTPVDKDISDQYIIPPKDQTAKLADITTPVAPVNNKKLQPVWIGGSGNLDGSGAEPIEEEPVADSNNSEELVGDHQDKTNHNLSPIVPTIEPYKLTDSTDQVKLKSGFLSSLSQFIANTLIKKSEASDSTSAPPQKVTNAINSSNGSSSTPSSSKIAKAKSENNSNDDINKSVQLNRGNTQSSPISSRKTAGTKKDKPVSMTSNVPTDRKETTDIVLTTSDSRSKTGPININKETVNKSQGEQSNVVSNNTNKTKIASRNSEQSIATGLVRAERDTVSTKSSSTYRVVAKTAKSKLAVSKEEQVKISKHTLLSKDKHSRNLRSIDKKIESKSNNKSARVPINSFHERYSNNENINYDQNNKSYVRKKEAIVKVKMTETEQGITKSINQITITKKLAYNTINKTNTVPGVNDQHNSYRAPSSKNIQNDKYKEQTRTTNITNTAATNQTDKKKSKHRYFIYIVGLLGAGIIFSTREYLVKNKTRKTMQKDK